jgi:hypothetical protein
LHWNQRVFVKLTFRFFVGLPDFRLSSPRCISELPALWRDRSGHAQALRAARSAAALLLPQPERSRVGRGNSRVSHFLREQSIRLCIRPVFPSRLFCLVYFLFISPHVLVVLSSLLAMHSSRSQYERVARPSHLPVRLSACLLVRLSAPSTQRRRRRRARVPCADFVRARRRCSLRGSRQGIITLFARTMSRFRSSIIRSD